MVSDDRRPGLLRALLFEGPTEKGWPLPDIEKVTSPTDCVPEERRMAPMNSLERKIGVVLFCALAALGALPVFAQDRPADNMEEVRKAIRKEKKLFIAQNMELTESEAVVFWPVYERYQKDQQALFDRTVELIEDYAKVYPKLSDTAAEKLLNDYLALEEDRVKLAKSYLPEFRRVLPVVKVARYYQLENKVRAVMYDELAAKIPVIQ